MRLRSTEEAAPCEEDVQRLGDAPPVGAASQSDREPHPARVGVELGHRPLHPGDRRELPDLFVNDERAGGVVITDDQGVAVHDCRGIQRRDLDAERTRAAEHAIPDRSMVARERHGHDRAGAGAGEGVARARLDPGDLGDVGDPDASDRDRGERVRGGHAGARVADRRDQLVRCHVHRVESGEVAHDLDPWLAHATPADLADPGEALDLVAELVVAPGVREHKAGVAGETGDPAERRQAGLDRELAQRRGQALVQRDGEGVDVVAARRLDPDRRVSCGRRREHVIDSGGGADRVFQRPGHVGLDVRGGGAGVVDLDLEVLVGQRRLRRGSAAGGRGHDGEDKELHRRRW